MYVYTVIKQLRATLICVSLALGQTPTEAERPLITGMLLYSPALTGTQWLGGMGCWVVIGTQ